jgi:WYL domain
VTEKLTKSTGKPENGRKQRGVQLRRLISELEIIQQVGGLEFSRAQIQKVLGEHDIHVEERTLQRDLAEFVEMKYLTCVEISHMNSKGTAIPQKMYRWTNRRLNTGGTSDELLLLYHFAIEHVNKFKNTSLVNYASETVAKLRGQIRQGDREKLEQYKQWVYIHSAFEPNTFIRDDLSMMFKAFPKSGTSHGRGTGRLITFNYKKAGATKPEAKNIEPHFVFIADFGAYLVGRDLSVENKPFKSYALNRVTGIRISEVEWEGEIETPESYFASSFGYVRTSGIAEQISLRFVPELSDYISERQWHKTQVIRNLPNRGVELSLRVRIERDLIQWVLSFGPGVEVIAGDRLTAEIKKSLEATLTLYQKLPARLPDAG